MNVIPVMYVFAAFCVVIYVSHAIGHAAAQLYF